MSPETTDQPLFFTFTKALQAEREAEGQTKGSSHRITAIFLLDEKFGASMWAR